MEKNDVVSIWFGNFETEEEFEEFISEKYDEEGDVLSTFMTSFGIDFIDTDFQEVLFQEVITIDDLSQFSYAESFIDKINKDILQLSNCVIFLYDFNYSGKIKSSNNLNFIGSYKYEKK
jgi:hypothetical protein